MKLLFIKRRIYLLAFKSEKVKMNIAIREATKEDVQVLSELSTNTFTETYSSMNTAENMSSYVNEHFNPQLLETEINDPRNKFFLAIFENKIAGYVKLCSINKPDQLKDLNPIEIERIYVLKQYQEQKVGATLMSYCISYAIKNAYDILWLGVWKHNDKAIAFYKRWDFETFGDHIFMLGNDAQTDILMKRKC